MKSLLFGALVVAAVVAPSAALRFDAQGRDQAVMNDALLKLEKFKKYFPDAEGDLEIEGEEVLESDLFADDGAGQDEEEGDEWMDSWAYEEEEFESEDLGWTSPVGNFPWDEPKPPHPPHRHPKKPGHPPPHGRFPWPPRPPHRPPHKHHPWPPHKIPHHKPIHTDKTIYELLSKSKYTKKVFEIVKNDEELSALFKNPDVNITFFVPTDKAFEPPHPHHPSHDSTDEPSKEFFRKAVLYHTSPNVYDTKKLWLSKTIPSGLKSDGGIGKDNYQRLSIGSGLCGMRVNFLAKIIAGNIYATNGIIHGVDNLIHIPPYAETLIGIFPTAFSTSALAFAKLELAGQPPLPEGPKTFFIPVNRAWKALGYKINVFLFSKIGEKYLAALMKYHVTHGKVVYSDYAIEEKTESSSKPKHYELDTFLGDHKLKVDIWRRGHWAKWVINGKTPAFLTDIITRDGVLQVPFRVLIPPHEHKENTFEVFSALDEEDEQYMGEEGGMTVEDLKARLEPYL